MIAMEIYWHLIFLEQRHRVIHDHGVHYLFTKEVERKIKHGNLVLQHQPLLHPHRSSVRCCMCDFSYMNDHRSYMKNIKLQGYSGSGKGIAKHVQAP